MVKHNGVSESPADQTDRLLKDIISSSVPMVSKGNCDQVYRCKKVICEVDQWLLWEDENLPHLPPHAPVVSDLCGPITQVIQWVTIKETQLGTAALQKEDCINQ